MAVAVRCKRKTAKGELLPAIVHLLNTNWRWEPGGVTRVPANVAQMVTSMMPNDFEYTDAMPDDDEAVVFVFEAPDYPVSRPFLFRFANIVEPLVNGQVYSYEQRKMAWLRDTLSRRNAVRVTLRIAVRDELPVAEDAAHTPTPAEMYQAFVRAAVGQFGDDIRLGGQKRVELQRRMLSRDPEKARRIFKQFGYDEPPDLSKVADVR
jgi:hypothetical protein